jgi:hypothetical protein
LFTTQFDIGEQGKPWKCRSIDFYNVQEEKCHKNEAKSNPEWGMLTWRWNTTSKLIAYEFKVPSLGSLMFCALAQHLICTASNRQPVDYSLAKKLQSRKR